jgi:hypothetical protein
MSTMRPRNTRLALLLRQFVDRQLEVFEKHVAGVQHLRPGIWRRTQISQRQPFIVLIRDGG